jgi:hypothetical protein
MFLLIVRKHAVINDDDDKHFGLMKEMLTMQKHMLKCKCRVKSLM